MQPNNQNPYQQNPTPSPADTPPQVTGYAGANVPEYLKLEPFHEPETRRSKKKLLILVAMLLGLAVSLFGYLWWSKYETERMFYVGLEKVLSVDSITVKTTLKSDVAKSLLEIETKSDKTEDGQRQSIHFKQSQEYPVRNSYIMADTQGQIIRDIEGRVVTRLTGYPALFSLGDYKLNEWYQPRSDDIDFWSMYDPLLLRQTGSDSFNVLPITNQPVKDPKRVTEFIEKNSTYVVKEVTSRNINGVEIFMYEILTTERKVAALKDEIAKLSNKSLTESALSTSADVPIRFEASVNKKSRMLDELWFVNADNDKTSIEVKFDYPGRYDVEMPKSIDLREAK